MNMQDTRKVYEAIKTNLELMVSSKGTSPLVGLDGFDEKMLAMFDFWYEKEASKIYKLHNQFNL